MLRAVQRGILGGTFDPPHFGHLLAGEAAYRDLNLDVVTYMPTGDPWQKGNWEIADAHHRVEMLLRAIDGVEYFEMDDRETRRPGPTYTIETLDEMSADEEITLVLGADAARSLRTWHRWEEVVARVRIAVAPRSGIVPEDVLDAVPGDLVWLDMTPVSLSGTDLRGRVRAGKSVRFMTPDAVWRYVDEHGLYV
jgi:nicotinate-nucleotide adenylyltransferase